MFRRAFFVGLTVLIALAAGACTPAVRVNNTAGSPTIYEDPRTVGAVAGIGMESQDIMGMTDKMVRDMLANPMLAGRTPSPRVIVDAEYFRNEGSTRLNKNMLTDRLRSGLMRAANGRILFISRESSDMVAKERDLKRQGLVSQGTLGSAQAQAGADFRLTGRITSQDALQKGTGMASRYHMVNFEMVDLETGMIVWTNIYEFKKSAADDIVYR